jgi:hypothetical protein
MATGDMIGDVCLSIGTDMKEFGGSLQGYPLIHSHLIRDILR